jgi:hypothetical protein
VLALAGLLVVGFCSGLIVPTVLTIATCILSDATQLLSGNFALLFFLAAVQIIQGYVNGVCFSLGKSDIVGLNWFVNSLSFFILVYATNVDASSNLLLLLIAACQASTLLAQIILSVKYFNMSFSSLTRKIPGRSGQLVARCVTFLRYGVKSTVVSSVIFASQWLLQTKIILGEGGLSENASYSLGSQMYNVVIFGPVIIGPLLLKALSSSADRPESQRQLCINAAKIFAALSLILCVLTYGLLNQVLPLLPGNYENGATIGAIAAGAASIHLMKAPFSIYFQSHLRLFPDMCASVVAALAVIAVVALLPSIDALIATGLRLVSHFVQFLIVLTWYALYISRRSPADSG